MNKLILQLCRSLKPTLAAVALMVLAWPGTGRLSAQTSGDEQPVTVGLRKQLFVDDTIVSSKSNVTRELGTVVKANDGKPLLVADKPWENADGFRLQLTWDKPPGFSALQGKLVRLKFSLRNAKLYAFQVCP